MMWNGSKNSSAGMGMVESGLLPITIISFVFKVTT